MITLSASDIKRLKLVAKKVAINHHHVVGRFQHEVGYLDGVVVGEVYFTHCLSCHRMILITIVATTGEPNIHGSCLIYECGDVEGSVTWMKKKFQSEVDAIMSTRRGS